MIRRALRASGGLRGSCVACPRCTAARKYVGGGGVSAHGPMLRLQVQYMDVASEATQSGTSSTDISDT